MRWTIFTLVLCLGLAACKPRNVSPQENSSFQAANHPTRPIVLTRIAFGSCAEQDKPQPILDAVIREKPDLFIYLGDNVYADTEDMVKLQSAYDELAERPEFQRLRAAMPILATWDDHDFGTNDIGRYYQFKKESKEIFLKFWREPKESSRWQHEGIYHSEYFGEGDKLVQVILLDTRTFRDDLILNDDKKRWKNDYRPNENADSTFLGESQWKWLESELKQPAVFRIIATSNQFCHEYNGWESWTTVPHEQKRFVDLIRDQYAEGVIFISGDVHWGELSMVKPEGLYPLYDMTSSGITETWPKTEPNKYRVGAVEPANNFGLFTIEWGDDPTLTMELKTVDGKNSVIQTVKRSELQIAD